MKIGNFIWMGTNLYNNIFAAKIFKIDNFYINNLMEIGKVIFIFFGLKSIYMTLNKILKIRILNNFIAILPL